VLHEHHGDVLGFAHVDDEARKVFFFFSVHAGHGFVHQQDLGLHRKRAAQVHALAQPVAQRAHGLVADAFDFEEVDDVLDHFAVLRFFALRPRKVEEGLQQARAHEAVAAHEDVVDHAHVRKQVRALKGAHDAIARNLVHRTALDAFAAVMHCAFLWQVKTAEHVHEGAFAGAIGADDGEQFIVAHVHRHFGKRGDAAEAQGDVLCLQHCGLGGPRRGIFVHGVGVSRGHQEKALMPVSARPMMSF